MVSLTSDCWTSNQTISYMCLTAHFIDCDWKLQKCIIGFNELAPPHSREVISDGIIECLIKWGIQDKISTITLDNASNNDRATNILMSNFKGKGKLHFDGLFFHIRCCAHILNLVVQDGLGTIESSLVKIREDVKYLRKSSGRLLKFGEIAITIGTSTNRSSCTDVKTRWNSTHHMLESAIHHKKVFLGYALRDSNFVRSPTVDECTIMVQGVKSKLKSLFDKYCNAYKTSETAMNSSKISYNESTSHTNDFFACLNSRTISIERKYELDEYLDEPNLKLMDPKFDVLKRWNQHCSKFPVLSKMAKEIFGIPITTVASESAFSAGGAYIG
ncbi:zinc finger BED domain-containing protein RICESLEEPER 2-like [Helianthus annuus]|uniref:zinc finger BED domain-containing protein RICESLEEPER 2-like n=1 Tax=Helianthus annuus TaxID=4232 RepID=UPI000B909B04|nr:zinc finger BED domain-containing protein RICESLEEPER 2-like [Helianthus annuus]